MKLLIGKVLRKYSLVETVSSQFPVPSKRKKREGIRAIMLKYLVHVLLGQYCFTLFVVSISSGLKCLANSRQKSFRPSDSNWLAWTGS